MLREFAWNAFEMTGNPDMYVFYKEITNFKGKEEAEAVNMEKPSAEGQTAT